MGIFGLSFTKENTVRESLHIYFEQLRYQEKNTDMYDLCGDALILYIYRERDILLSHFFVKRKPSIPVISVISNVAPPTVIYVY